MAKLQAQALIAIFIRERVIGVVVAWVAESGSRLIMKRSEVLTTVIVVVLHDLLSLLDDVLSTLCFRLFASGFLSFFGICRVCLELSLRPETFGRTSSCLG